LSPPQTDMGNSGQQASKRKDRVAAVRGSSMASGRFQDVNDGREKSFRIWHTFLIVEDWAWVGGASCECVLSVLSVYVRVRVRVCVCVCVRAWSLMMEERVQGR
jgi:hypothetical protein